MAKKTNKKESPEKEAVLKKDKNVEIVKKQEKETTYIMRVGKLSWGKNNKNFFFNDKKPLISKSVMKEYAHMIDKWLVADWIEEGSYK